METYVVRMWLPDRPGALGQVASRIGAVRGEIVGIDILERGAGRAIDELVVELPDGSLQELLVQEIQQVDGVDVEEVRPVADALHDPRLDALETAAILVGRHRSRRAGAGRRRARSPGRRGGVVGRRAARGRRGARRRRAPCRPRRGWSPSSRAASRRLGWPRARPGPTTSSGRPSRRRAWPSSSGATAPRTGRGSGGRSRRWPGIVDTRLREIIRYSSFLNHPSVARCRRPPDALRHPHRRQPAAHPEADPHPRAHHDDRLAPARRWRSGRPPEPSPGTR